MIFRALCIVLLSMYASFVAAQNNTVVNSRTGHASAILDLSNNTGTKAFLPPRVQITGLASTTTPVTNPAEGLIVYNIGAARLPGYYIFVDGVWSLMATRENSIMNAFYENKTATAFTTSTSFVTVGGFSLLGNNTGGDIALSGTNSFVLQPGKYVVTVMLNITTTETSSGAAISNGTVHTHAHYYTGRLWDGAAALGQTIQLNAISNTSGDKKHSLMFNFSFELTTPKTVNFQLARRTGGTYTGNITLNNSSVFIEKSLP